MPHISESKIATVEALLAVASASWKESKTVNNCITVFMDNVIREMPSMIDSMREYNEALRVAQLAMKQNNWHRIKDGKGLVPEPLSAEDAYRLVCDALQEKQQTL